MALLDTASLIVTPNGYKASKLYSIVPSDGTGDMTFSRTGNTATRVNSSGLIETVNANIPRLDYSDGTCPKLLLEPQRTNVLLNSATLSTQSVTTTAVSYTLSFYGTGTIVLTGAFVRTLTGTGASNRVSTTFTSTAAVLTLTITGSVTNAQLEAGSFATSYIPTTSASVTRNADTCSKTSVTALIGQTEGTLFAEFTLDYINSTIYRNAININDGTYSNSIGILVNNSSGQQYTGYVNNGGTIQAVINGPILTSANVGTRYKIAFAYKANDFILYINGTQIGTDISGTIPSSLSRIDIGSIGFTGLNALDCQSIKSAAHWKTRLTNSELAQLTTL
jgi:hypothetical protein